MVRDISNSMSYMDFYLAYLPLTLAHFKGKVTVKSISTFNMYEMVTDRVKITIAIKYQVMHGHSIGVTTFDLGQFKGQGHAHFHNEYLGNDEI